ARPAVIRASAATLSTAGIEAGTMAELATDTGRIAMPTEAVDMPDGVVWAPTNSAGQPLRRLLGVDHGSFVRLESSDALPAQQDVSQVDELTDVAGAYYVEGDGDE